MNNFGNNLERTPCFLIVKCKVVPQFVPLNNSGNGCLWLGLKQLFGWFGVPAWPRKPPCLPPPPALEKHLFFFLSLPFLLGFSTFRLVSSGPGLGTTTDLENDPSKMRFLHSKPCIPTFKHVWSKLWRWLFQIHIFNQWPKTFKTLQYFLYLLVIYFENAHAQNMHRMPYIVPKSHGHWIAMGTTRHFFHLGNRHRLTFLICVCLGMLTGLTPHRLWSGAHHLRSLAMERVLFFQLVCFATCEYM